MSVFRSSANSVYTDITFDHRQAGAPGLAHGGALAAACDDLFGFLLYLAQAPAVTKTLQVDYLAPVPLNEPHRITALLDRSIGKKLYVSAVAVGTDGSRRFTATALFIIVPRAHFERFGTFEDHPGLGHLALDRARLPATQIDGE